MSDRVELSREVAYRRAYDALVKAATVVAPAISGAEVGTLVVLDITGMAEVNRHHGLDSGDHLLAEVEESIRAQFAAIGQVCRLAGDQFAIVVPGRRQPESIKEATHCAVHCASIEAPDSETIRVTARVGVATWHDPSSGLGALSAATDDLRRSRRMLVAGSHADRFTRRHRA